MWRRGGITIGNMRNSWGCMGNSWGEEIEDVKKEDVKREDVKI